MKKFFTSIWFIAGIITIPVVLLLPPVFSKYSITEKQLRTNANQEYSTVYFEDLNGDGTKEIIEGFKYWHEERNIHAIQYFNENGRIYDQINFEGSYFKRISPLFFADLNHNKLTEVYAFTLKSDSLFLNVVEPFGTVNKSFFVIRNNRSQQGELDLMIRFGHFAKLTGNPNQQFIFSLEQGFSIRPKCVFIFDLESGTFRHTPLVGNNNLFVQTFQNPLSGKWEIIADGNAGNIIKDSVNIFLKDDRPYLKIYDEQLRFKFAPVAFPKGITAFTQTYPVFENGKLFYLSYYDSRSALSPNPTVYKISSQGEIIDSLRIQIKQGVRQGAFIKNGKNFWLYCERGVIRKITPDLKIIDEQQLPDKGNYYGFEHFDINEDGVTEYFCKDSDTQTEYLFTDNFNRRYTLGKGLLAPGKVKKNLFFAHTPQVTKTFRFQKNPYRFFFLPLIVLLYLFFVMLVWLIRKTQESRLKEKYELQQKVRELQLATFKGQMNPHFVFNTINSIVSVAIQGRKDEAYDLITRFSNVLRKSLQNTEVVLVKLSDEITLVKNFVAIQQFRFKNLFDFEFVLDESINPNTVLIPKMIIQIHVENAIKHGLRPKHEMGLLRVKIEPLKTRGIRIEITDNGIGRSKAQQLNTEGTRLGLKTMDEFIKEINLTEKLYVKQQFFDKTDKFGKAEGTQVVIEIIPKQ